MPAYPLIEFTFSIGTWEAGGNAFPDTGFEGGLIIPAGMGRELIAAATVTPWRLADGSLRDVKTWSGTVTLQDHAFRVEIIAVGNRYLLGREVLDQLEVCFRFGREVTLRFVDGA